MTAKEAARIINAIKCSMVTTPEEHEALTIAERVLWEAETRWIPVSERLPETHKEPCIFQKSYECSDSVLAYLSEPYDDSYVCIAVYDKGDATFLRYGWGERFTDEEVHVVAWMPLPEPYKEVKP